MITVTKQENGVLFTFTNSDKYLYGSGTIEVPFNSLSIIQDESDNITLRKSASNDIFLSARYDTDFGYASKEEAVSALKEILYDEAGISEEEVQEMIDAATSGIPSSEVVEQLRTDVNAVSGEVDTLQDDVASKADASALTAVNDALTGHTANTNIHVTSTDKSNWDAKQDALTAGANITISGNVISAEAGNNIIELTQAEYDALETKDPEALYIITDAQEINMNDYATKTDLVAKADVSALTAVSDAVSGKADASAVTAVANDVQTVSGQVATKVETSDFNAFSASTDARIAEDEEVTAAALNDLAEAVSGKQDTLISGENIKTINNESILGSGNITISGGGDYQYYSEDTTNESATIEVGEQSLTVDGNGVYVNNSPVVTAEELDDNYYGQQVIDEKEEVIASALTQLNQDVAEIDAKEEVIASALTELNLRVTEDEEVTAAALNDLDDAVSGKADASAITSIESDITAVSNGLNTLSGAVIDNEYTVSQAINSLNNRVTAVESGGSVTVDTTLDSGSTNPVQNAVITQALNAKADTSAITTAITSGSTDSEIPTAKATYDAIQAGGGGGATYSAGTNISIDTANTINCTLNLRNGTGQNSITGVNGQALGNASIAWGYNALAKKDESVVIGANSTAKEIRSIAVGQTVNIEGPWSCGFGINNNSYGRANAIFGINNTTRNGQEAAFGTYNNSVTGSTASGQTLFSVGNGTPSLAHNAFEIRQNGDIYVNDGTNDVKLQDTITATTANTTALGGLKFVKISQTDYDALVTKDANTLYIISD